MKNTIKGMVMAIMLIALMVPFAVAAPLVDPEGSNQNQILGEGIDEDASADNGDQVDEVVDGEDLLTRIINLANEAGNPAYAEFTTNFEESTVEALARVLENRHNVPRTDPEALERWLTLNGITQQDIDDFNANIWTALHAMQDAQLNLFFAVDAYNNNRLIESNDKLDIAEAAFQSFTQVSDVLQAEMDSWIPLGGSSNDNIDVPAVQERTQPITAVVTTVEQVPIAQDEVQDDYDVLPITGKVAMNVDATEKPQKVLVAEENDVAQASVDNTEEETTSQEIGIFKRMIGWLSNIFG